MKNTFVKVEVDLFCDWKKAPPVYRLYINHDLFTERTYVWGATQYLQEIISLDAPPGRYTIRVDNLGDPDCQFKLRNLTASVGPVRIIDSKTFEITNESA
jgi:hypothetical protein